MSGKVIITAAITGGVHIPSMSPYLPIFPNQIIEQAVGAAKAGAAILHIHARDPENGKPISNPDIMEEIVTGIRKETNALLSVTTGGAIGMSVQERLASIPRVKPEIASLNPGSFNFCFSPIADKITDPIYDWEIPFVKNTYNLVFENTFGGVEEYLKTMDENGTKPEFEIYDSAMIHNIAYFVKKGMVKKPFYIQFVLGIMGGLPATIDNLTMLLHIAKEELGEENFVWSCAAAGRQQFNVVTTAVALGGNIRIGLEDNLYLRKGVLAKSNAEHVEKMKSIIELLDLQVATVDDAKSALQI